MRFVKENFLADRVFYNITDLNWHALEWCNSQNGTYHRAVDGVSQRLHMEAYGELLGPLPELDEVQYPRSIRVVALKQLNRRARNRTHGDARGRGACPSYSIRDGRLSSGIRLIKYFFISSPNPLMCRNI